MSTERLALYRAFTRLATEGKDPEDDSRTEILGFDILEESQLTYVVAKRVLSEMVREGYFKDTGNMEKGRRGRPAIFWQITEKGEDDFSELVKAHRNREENPTLLTRLKKSRSGRIRLPLPIDKDLWRDVVRMGKEGKINLIVELKEEYR